jgi:hypothetical protein
MDVTGGSTAPGAELILWPCHNGANQFFRLQQNRTNNTRIAVYEGGVERCLGHASRTHPGGSTNTWHKIVTMPCASAPAWTVHANGDIQLLTAPPFAYETCISVQPNYKFMYLTPCMFRNEGFGTNWTLPAGQRTHGQSLLSYGTTYVCLDVWRQGRSPGTAVVHHACNGGAHQRFEIRGNADEAMLSVYEGREMLCLSNLSTSKVRAVACNEHDPRQRWYAGTSGTWNGFPVYQFHNYKTQQCLDASRSSKDAITWPCHTGTNQRWVY